MTVAPDIAPSPGTVIDDVERSGRRGGSAFLRSLLASPKALFGLAVLAIFTATALLAPVLAPGDPSAFVAVGAQPPSAEHLLGTTPKGQDVLALTVWGSRSSLTVGALVGVITLTIAVLVGLLGAYFRGWVDDTLTLVTNIVIVIPGLPLLIILAAFLPPSPATIVLVLSITGWAGAARVLRSQALSIRERDFVAASTVTGEGALRIMVREILPNMASVTMSAFLGCVIMAIGAQAGLEFLGLGDLATVSWGTNLYWASNDGAMLSGYWWTFLPSGLSIALVAFALAMVNFAVDELTNPRLARPSKKARNRR